MPDDRPIDVTRMTVSELAAATAARTPTPGGGSIAGVVAALGTSLAEMALAFTHGKKAFAAHEADYERIGRHFARARAMFLQLVADDMAAYTLYQESAAATGPDRDDRVQLALAAAINVPREMAKLALAVLDDMGSLAPRCNAWLVSDLAAGAVLAEAVVRLCDWNVRVNAKGYADRAAADEVCASSRADCDRARAALAAVDAAAAEQV